MALVAGATEVKEHTLKCFCSRKPILAIAGRDAKDGTPFIHIKSMRQDRINAEAVVTSGEVRVRCRECLRWHKFRIVRQNIESKVDPLPETIAVK